MKVSINWLKQFGGQGLNVSVDELVRKIGAQLGGVEAVDNLGEKYQGIVIAKVVKCEDHPNADRLHICTIDDGGITPDVNRDENGYIQVVCGAPNVRAGLTVAWLPPGSTVPDSFDKDRFVLEARELRGVVSNGMLASPKELALGDNHDGILEINDGDFLLRHPELVSGSRTESTSGEQVPGVLKQVQHDELLKPGADFATVFGLNDTIIDIENKMFTHRPDLFGQLGVAREIAGISGQSFTSPSWYADKPEFPDGSGLDLDVVNEAPEVVPRLMTLTMKGVTIKPSPLWLQCALASVGAKPINNVVDVTNYIMLMTAQPTHAYDYDKLRGHQLVARLAKPGEHADLLNHKTYALDPTDIVIADAEGSIGLGGVMGGGDSEVTDATTNLVLECANFDMYTVRRTSMRHGIFTDALTRFNKGQSPLQNDHVLHLLMQSIQDVAGGEAAGAVADIGDVADRAWVHPPVPVTVEFINSRLGFDLSAEAMKQLLENVEFMVEIRDQRQETRAAAVIHDSELMTADSTAELLVTAPFWRTDVETREDVVEEIGRLYGFDHLPLELPRRDIKPAVKNPDLEAEAALRTILVQGGANEVLNYSFVHGNLLQKAGQDTSQAFSLSNALSPDLQYYRLSLTPSLLEKIRPNAKASYGRFSLFEIGTVYGQGEVDDEGLPQGFGRVALVYASNKNQAGASYYIARKQALNVLQDYVDVSALRFVTIAEAKNDFADHKTFQQLVAPYDDQRAAVVYNNNAPVGVIGEFKPTVVRELKLPPDCAGFELFISAFQQQLGGQYRPLSRFPSVRQDITLKTPADVPYERLVQTITNYLENSVPAESLLTILPTGIFQRPDDVAHKQVTFRVSLASYERTLTDAEVAKLLDGAAEAASVACQAQRV